MNSEFMPSKSNPSRIKPTSPRSKTLEDTRVFSNVFLITRELKFVLKLWIVDVFAVDSGVVSKEVDII